MKVVTASQFVSTPEDYSTGVTLTYDFPEAFLQNTTVPFTNAKRV